MPVLGCLGGLGWYVMDEYYCSKTTTAQARKPKTAVRCFLGLLCVLRWPRSTSHFLFAIHHLPSFVPRISCLCFVICDSCFLFVLHGSGFTIFCALHFSFMFHGSPSAVLYGSCWSFMLRGLLSFVLHISHSSFTVCSLYFIVCSL